jgi:hypothetical protein
MITGQIPAGEYVTAHQVHRRKVAFVMNMVMALVFVAGALVFMAISKKWGIIIAVCGLGGLIGEFAQNRIAMPARLRRLYAQTKGRVDVTYSWDAEKLFLASEHGEAARPWSDFTKAREDNDVILLYYNDAFFEIVSKRWFGNQAQLDEFRRHLRLVK